MLLLTTTIVASLSSAATAPATVQRPLRGQAAVAPSEKCLKASSYVAVQPGQKLTPRKLNELPPANAYRAVYRIVGGCEVPVVVKYRVGGR